MLRSITCILSLTTIVVFLVTSHSAMATSNSYEENDYKKQLIGTTKAISTLAEEDPIVPTNPDDGPKI